MLDEPLVLLPVSEFKRLVREAVREEMCTREPERSVTAAEFAELEGTDAKRVRRLCEAGMPSHMIADRRGLRIVPSEARAWLLEQRHG